VSFEFYCGKTTTVSSGMLVLGPSLGLKTSFVGLGLDLTGMSGFGLGLALHLWSWR